MNAIQPATAERNDGLCGPCAGKRDRAVREAFVRANRRDVDRFAGVTDPVEMLLLMHRPPRPDPLVNLLPPPREMNEAYASLSPSEARRLADAVFERAGLDESARESIASCLAAFTNTSLDELLEHFLDRGEVPDAIAFRGAGVGVRDRLARLLDGCEMNANLALASLAFIGDESVVAWFDAW